MDVSGGRCATYVSQVLSALRTIGETTVGCRLGGEAVDATRPPGDLGAAHLLDGADTAERPEVAVGDPGELLLDALHEVACDVQASVCAVLGLGLEAHGGVIAVRL